MTFEETGRIMRAIKAAYPKWEGCNQDTVLLWAQLFADDPVEAVGAAVKTYIASDIKGFPPVIGQIKQLMLKVRDDSPSEQAAWALVRKAISNGLYGSYEEFEKLPPILQKVVGDPSQLERWAMLEDGLDTVVASNVMRSYRTELEKQRFMDAVPADVRNALTGGYKQIGG